LKTDNYKKKLDKARFTDNTYNPTEQKIDLRFDKESLEMFIGYVFSNDPNISKMNLANLQKLMNIINIQVYEPDAVLYARINIIINALNAKLQEGIEKPEILKMRCISAAENDEETIKCLQNFQQYMMLSRSEIDYLTKAVVDRLTFGFMYWHKDEIFNQFMRIDQGDFKSLREVTEAIKRSVNNMMSDIRKAENVSNLSMFSLESGIMDAFVEDTIRHAADPNNALITGIRLLNSMLSPGFIGGRCYYVLACTGTFKSAFLLLCAYWIKKYNRVVPKRRESNCRPTVFLCIAENDIEETIMRLFNSSVTSDDITLFTPEEAVKRMREEGGLTLNEGETDIVIKYFANNELSPNVLSAEIDMLEEDNREVICLIVDYLKRMRSDNYAADERIKYRDITNGLKDLSIRYKIPVLSAQQINRSGNMVIDSAMEGGKSDLARFLGRGNIAESWDILENADWAAILNVEIDRTDNKRYLTIKEIKKRYKSQTDITYFNHPFEPGSTIMLVEDINRDESVSKISLTSDFTSAEMVGSKRSKRNGRNLDIGEFMLANDDLGGEYVEFPDEAHTKGPQVSRKEEL
jgi:hypothetical protein